MRIIIIGAVAAGLAAAAKARRNDEGADIVVYEKGWDISYSGCGLPFYLGGFVEKLSALIPRDAAYFKDQYAVDVLTGHEVVSVDAAARTLLVRRGLDGALLPDHYDALVLATGATSTVPPIPGVDGEGVFTLRSPDDARRIREFMDRTRPETAVILGSGLIGLEMAENFTAAGLSVTLVEKMPRVAPALLDEDLSPHLLAELEKRCRVLTGRAATAITGGTVTLDNGEILPAGLVLVATGIRPSTALARAMGAALGPTGAIGVDDRMQTSLPGVYACGDCAETVSAADGRPLYHPLGSTANVMGRVAGDAITGGSLRMPGIAGTAIVRAFDVTAAATGLSEEQARQDGLDPVSCINIKPDRPPYLGGRDMVIKAVADRSTGRLLGAQIVGPAGVDKRIDVFAAAVTWGISAPDLQHLDLAYAPPFSTTRDPVLYTGMILYNALEKDRPLLPAAQLLGREGDYTVVDARAESQYAAGHVPGALGIPHRRLRAEAGALPRDKPVVVYCNKGVTGNAAQNALRGRGFPAVYNLAGGFRQYRARKGGADGEPAGREPSDD